MSFYKYIPDSNIQIKHMSTGVLLMLVPDMTGRMATEQNVHEFGRNMLIIHIPLIGTTVYSGYHLPFELEDHLRERIVPLLMNDLADGDIINNCLIHPWSYEPEMLDVFVDRNIANSINIIVTPPTTLQTIQIDITL